MYGLIFEGIIAVLLLLTIGFSWKLSKRITVLHKSRQELNKFIGDFNIAIARAENNIAELRELEQKADTTLASHIEQAKYLAQDLNFLAERGETIADNLEQQIEIARSAAPRGLQAAVQRSPKKPPAATPAQKETLLPPLPRRAPMAVRELSGAEPATPLAPTETFTPFGTPAPSRVDPVKAREIEKILTSGVIPPRAQPKPPAPPRQPGTIPPSKKQAMDEVLAQIAQHKAAISAPAPQPSAPPAPSLQPQSASIPVASPVPPTAAKLNETIDRVFNKKRLELIREKAEK